MRSLRYIANVSTLALDTKKCVGCTMCLEVCPRDVFAMENKKAKIKDRDACMECGACALNCEPQAITVNSGVGCATGVILGAIKGSGEPCCG